MCNKLMGHWVYVLQSSETGAIYVGETTRLFRRWREHYVGRGGVTTSHDNYDKLIGLYDVSHNNKFLDFLNSAKENRYEWRTAYYWDNDADKTSALRIENQITERYKHEGKNVKGGKYCREGCVFDLTNITIDRPLCKCGYPCEVKMKKDQTKIYFVCPVPEWTDHIEIINPCNFWEEYKPYRVLREQHLQKRREEFITQRRKENLAAFIEATKDD